MITGELAASLITVMLPAAFPVAVGVNVTFMVALCPGVRICPVDTPMALKPAPEMLTFEMVTLAFPEFVSVEERVLLAPTFRLPKLKLDGLAVSVMVTTGGALLVVTLGAG